MTRMDGMDAEQVDEVRRLDQVECSLHGYLGCAACGKAFGSQAGLAGRPSGLTPLFVGILFDRGNISPTNFGAGGRKA
jgi:hypothetical protein